MVEQIDFERESREWLHGLRIYQDILEEARQLAEMHLAPRLSLHSWYRQFDSRFAQERATLYDGDPILDYDPRRHYEPDRETATDRVQGAFLDARQGYRLALGRAALAIAKKYRIPLRAVHALCAALDIHGTRPDEDGSFNGHCESKVPDVISFPSIKLRREWNGDVTVSIPANIDSIPEELHTQVNEFRATGARSRFLPFFPPEEGRVKHVRLRDVYHNQRVLLNRGRQEVADAFGRTKESVDDGVQEHKKDWVKSCGGPSLPVLETTIRRYFAAPTTGK